MNEKSGYMDRLRQAFISAIDEDDLRNLAKQMMAEAKMGDKDARKFILGLVMTQPAPLAPQINAKRVAIVNGHPQPSRLVQGE